MLNENNVNGEKDSLNEADNRKKISWKVQEIGEKWNG